MCVVHGEYKDSNSQYYICQRRALVSSGATIYYEIGPPSVCSPQNRWIVFFMILQETHVSEG